MRLGGATGNPSPQIDTNETQITEKNGTKAPDLRKSLDRAITVNRTNKLRARILRI